MASPSVDFYEAERLRVRVELLEKRVLSLISQVEYYSRRERVLKRQIAYWRTLYEVEVDPLARAALRST